MNFIFRHKFIGAILILGLIAGGYFGYQRLTKNNAAASYVTAAVEKGALIVSVSGTGQVMALNQVDIKSKVSGQITAFYIKQDQEVKEGDLLLQLDAKSAQQTISDAEIALESAKIKLEDLLSPPDAQDLLQAENGLAQAKRDLDKAKKNYENIEADTERALDTAYEDGYSDVSTIFFKLSDYMKDLRDVLGTEKSEQEYVGYYKIILGKDSLFISRLVSDYYSALDLYNENFAFFREVFRDDDRVTIYKLISDTLKTAEAISQTLESSRHMYDAITATTYKQYYIASTIDKMQPKVESDLSSIFSNITSLRKVIDSIDGANEDTPDKIKDSELAFKSAQEKLEEKKIALEELKAGADPLDIRAQQNVVAQKEEAFLTAKENLAEHFIRAPFEGVIAKTNVKKGDSVSSNTAIATFITRQRVAEITLNEIDAAKVKTGQKATLTFDAVEGLTITGEVIEVDAIGTVSQGVVTYNVKIAFDTQDERIKPGMSLSAAVITDAKQDALLAPNSAIKYQGGVGYARVMANDNTVHSQQIEVGVSNDTHTEIISGLNEGDKVVTQTIAAGQSSSNSNNSSNNNSNNRGVVPGGGEFMRIMR